MKENIKNLNVLISYWLLITTLLVALIIIVGGLTRLTDSGLSITRWDLFSGILPPLTQADWKNYFELYKKIPEFQLVNFNMTLDEFKVIFLWEYAHRLLGRVVGLFYLIPLVIFSFLKCLNKKYIFNYYLILLLIVLQGVVGWYMVKSGLSERTDVSHYRLSVHLTLAFVIFTFLFWNYLKLTKAKKEINVDKFISRIIKLFFLLIIFQISLGALVSGLDAGTIYNTWPLMNGNFFPDDSLYKDLFKFSVLENPSLLQFIHRITAYAIFFIFILIAILIFKNKNLIYLRKISMVIFSFLIFQIFLGVLTVISGAEILLASMHQIGSIILVSGTLILVFQSSKIN
tara:strand:- start:1452 stop:2483 length:1032 start_codon:yes stop_codon:yes gene_type:complete